MINSNILHLEPYLLDAHKVRTSDKDEKAVKLDRNENTFNNDALKKHLWQFIVQSNLNYYPNTFNTTLLHSLSEYLSIWTDHILYFNGSDDALDNILSLWLWQWAKAWTIKPSYDSFRIFVEKRGNDLLYLVSDPFYEKPHIDTIKKFIVDNQVDLFYLITPHNPLWFAFSQEEIHELVSWFPDTNFIIDQAYAEFSSSKIAYIDFAHSDNVIFVRTFSKALGIASLRFGYISASTTIIDYLRRYRNPKSINAISQEAVVYTLANREFLDMYIKQVQDSYQLLTAFLQSKNIDYRPSEWNFMLIYVDSTYKENLRRYLENHHIFIRFLGDPLLTDRVRITLWDTEHISHFIAVFDEFLAQYT